MSRSFSRLIGSFCRNNVTACAQIKPFQFKPTSHIEGEQGLLSVAPVHVLLGASSYSKRNGPPSDENLPFKTVRKSRRVEDDDQNGIECEPNWELLSRKNNRFYLPNAIGPAWQGDSTTVNLLTPLSKLVNFFKDPNLDKSRLELTCCFCPLLIRETLFELFPVHAVSQKGSTITLLTLSYEGDIELGAAQFVLAARDISDRLLSQGYWADFVNPFSGHPYFVPKEDWKMYKQDHRFRGLNMRLSKLNHCLVIAPEENDKSHFSGAIYCTAPNNYDMLVELLVPAEYKLNIEKTVEYPFQTPDD